LRVGDEHVLGPAGINRVAETPPAGRLVSFPAVTALRAVNREVRAALTARGGGAHNDPVGRCEASSADSDLLDPADGLLTEGKARLCRVVSFQDVHVRTADGPK
jgi:hypothetical protein